MMRLSKTRAGLASPLIRLGITGSTLFLILRNVNLHEAVAVLGHTQPDLLGAALLMQFCSTAVAAYRWHLIMHNLNFDQPLRFYWNSYFKGMLFNQALPTSIGGDAVRVIDVARQGFRKRDAFYGVAIDRVAGFVALIVLALIAYAVNPVALPAKISQPVLIIAAAGLFGALGVLLVRRVACLDTHPRLSFVRTVSARTLLAFAKNRARLLVSSLLVPILAITGFFVLGKALGLPFGAMTYFGIVPLALLLTILPISIAGWGVREGALVGLFGLIGASQEVVLMMSLLYGLMLILVSLPGLIVLMRDQHQLANHG